MQAGVSERNTEKHWPRWLATLNENTSLSQNNKTHPWYTRSCNRHQKSRLFTIHFDKNAREYFSDEDEFKASIRLYEQFQSLKDKGVSFEEAEETFLMHLSDYDDRLIAKAQEYLDHTHHQSSLAPSTSGLTEVDIANIVKVLSDKKPTKSKSALLKDFLNNFISEREIGKWKSLSSTSNEYQTKIKAFLLLINVDLTSDLTTDDVSHSKNSLKNHFGKVNKFLAYLHED